MIRLLSVPFLITLTLSSSTARNSAPLPDFTRGGETDGSHDWNLGATGASGWIYALPLKRLVRDTIKEIQAATQKPELLQLNL